MPTYGDDKKRDMSRSILPSSWRWAKETRRRHHKKARTHERILLDELDVSQLDLEEGICDVGDFTGLEKTRSRDLRGMVKMRRSSDKVAPMMRWAESITKTLPIEDRLSKVRAIMPKGVIGEHAVSHLVWNDHFRTSNNIKHYPKKRSLETVLVELLRNEVLRGAQADVNRAIKKAHKNLQVYKETPRTLKGIHDVEDFVREVIKASEGFSRVQGLWVQNPLFHAEWLQALRGYFEEELADDRIFQVAS